MSGQNCGGCGKVTSAGFICTECVGRVRTILADVPHMFDELRIALTRQAKFSNGGGTQSGETPLIYNDSATRAETSLGNTLRQWQGKYADHLNPMTNPANVRVPYRIAEPVRYPNPIACALWIDDKIAHQGVARWTQAPAMYRALKDAHERATKAVQPPPLRWYAGQCGDWYTPEGQSEPVQCLHDLYADDKNGVMKCPRCGATHEVYARRNRLLTEAEEQLLTATEAARAVVVWSDYERGENHLAHNIVVWADRGRLEARTPRFVDGQLRPTYKLKDIRVLIAEYEQRMAARSRKATK